MEFNKEIFRAYDIRGLLDEVTPEIAHAVGVALVAKLGGKKILVGRDMRKTSPELSEALKDGVMKAGGDVIDIGLTTTSMFNWAVIAEKADLGAMITASHNPAEYNGIKVAKSDGEPISGMEMYELVKDQDAPVSDRQGTVLATEVRDNYIDAVLRAGKELNVAGAKLVVDYGNGMGAVTIRPLLERLGVSVTELYAEPDASFPNHEANPAKEETLVDLKKKIVETGADFGVAVDGDGDRIGFVDNEGVSLRGDQTLALLAESILRDHPGEKVVVAPNHGWAATRYIESHGGELVGDRIGRTFAIKRMRESNVAIGGEISSHFFYRDFNYLESIDYTLVLLLSIWKKSGKTFAELARPLRAFHNSGEVNFEIKNKQAALDLIKKTYAPGATVVNELDGIRCEFDDAWWFIVRPSNTEPLIRLTVEAKDEVILKEKLAELSSLLKNV